MLSVVADEISFDLETAVSLGWRWGLREFELRRVYLERAPYYPETFYELLPSLARTYRGIRFVAVSPGLFKCPVSHWSVPHQIGLKLDASFHLAETVGCRTVVVFGFEREPGAPRAARAPQQVVDSLGQVAAKAAGRGYQVVLEIESGSYADCGTAAAELVEAVGSPALGVNMQRWDPEVTGDSFEAGFQRVRRHVRHMHYHGINAPELATQQPFVDFGWAAKIRALMADGYRGHISLETHLKPRLEKSEAALVALRRELAAAGCAE